MKSIAIHSDSALTGKIITGKTQKRDLYAARSVPVLIFIGNLCMSIRQCSDPRPPPKARNEF